MFEPIVFERLLFLVWLVWNSLRAPYLAVGMGVAATHDSAPVFENLDVVDIGKVPDTSVLLRPHTDDSANFGRRHLRERQVVTWRGVRDIKVSTSMLAFLGLIS
jgi:hypothetical protein